MNDAAQFQRYVSRPEIRQQVCSHEAGHAILADHFGYRVIHISIEGKLVPEGSPEAMLISNGELAAIGGDIEIRWGPIDPNARNFDECLQDIATILMGGKAAEELTHPASRSNHWKADVAHFKEPFKKYRTEAQMDNLLQEGYQRAKVLLSNPKLAAYHRWLRDCLIAGVYRDRPNGSSLIRAMKGLNEQQ